MFEERDRALKWKLLVWDIAIAASALLAAYGIRVALPGADHAIDPMAHFSMLPIFLVLMFGSLSYYGAYTRPAKSAALAFTWAVARGLFLAFCGLIALLFAMRIHSFSRGVLGLFGVLVFPGILALRFYYTWLFHLSLKQESNFYKVLIIGTGNRAVQLVNSLRKSAEPGIEIIGYLDPDSKRMGIDLPESSVLGTVAEIRTILKRQVVDEVILAVPRSMFEEVEEIVRACEEEGIKFRIMADLYNTQVSKVSLMTIGEIPLLTLEPVALDQGKLLIKRSIDFMFSAVSIILLLPFMVLIALAVKVDSPGPVFFRQQRVGLRKRRFEMLKFRSMFEGSEEKIQALEHLNEAAGPIFKITDDPRITAVGRFLRQTSLDELPQLFNILKGEMSLVGPRPMSLRDVALFDQSIQRKRFSVKPGLTCLWQISGRSNLPFSKWLELDLQYIESWNLMLDFKILLKTIPAVLSGEGAK
jgi:exopolysaccharide biosynthesis polyprenyl glycosylphosphotransferase